MLEHSRNKCVQAESSAFASKNLQQSKGKKFKISKGKSTCFNSYKEGHWDAKGRKGFMMGYDLNSKGYRIYFSDNNKVEVDREVVFGNELKELETSLIRTIFFSSS